jgi:hypothetical protein
MLLLKLPSELLRGSPQCKQCPNAEGEAFPPQGAQNQWEVALV